MNKNAEAILLVEDNPDDAELTKLALARHGLDGRVTHVSDGMQALDYLYRRDGFTDRSGGNPILVLLDLKMPVLGFRFGDFTYITDANYIDPEELEKVKGSKVLILNALRPEPHPTHFTLSEAIELTKTLAIPQTYFTHFSHQIGLHAIVEPSLPKGIGMSFDGMVITL